MRFAVLAPVLALALVAAAPPRAAESPPRAESVKEAPPVKLLLELKQQPNFSSLDLARRLAVALEPQANPENFGTAAAVMLGARYVARSDSAHRTPVRSTRAVLNFLADSLNTLDPGRCTRARYARGERHQV